jgi:protein subunit release factor A
MMDEQIKIANTLERFTEVQSELENIQTCSKIINSQREIYENCQNVKETVMNFENIQQFIKNDSDLMILNGCSLNTEKLSDLLKDSISSTKALVYPNDDELESLLETMDNFKERLMEIKLEERIIKLRGDVDDLYIELSSMISK